MEILEKIFFSRSIFTRKAPSQMFDSVLHAPLELLTIFAKSFILDVQLCSEYAHGIVNYFSKRLRSSHERQSVRKDVLRNFAKFTGNTCVRVFFNKVAGLAQVFSCEFSEISKNTFSQNNSGRLLRKALSQTFVQVQASDILKKGKRCEKPGKKLFLETLQLRLRNNYQEISENSSNEK